MGATYTFGGTTSDYASVASQAKFGTPTTLAIKARVKGTFFTAISAYFQNHLFRMAHRGALKMGVYRDGDSSPNPIRMFAYWDANGNANNATTPAFTVSDIDPSAFYIFYWHLTDSGSDRLTMELYTSAGSLVGSYGSGADNLSGVENSGSGNGALRIGNDGAIAWPWTLDGIAFYSSVLPGAARYSAPSSGDANIIGLYKFDEATGTSVADATGGTSLTLAGSGTWNTNDGAWDGAASVPLRVWMF